MVTRKIKLIVEIELDFNNEDYPDLERSSPANLINYIDSGSLFAAIAEELPVSDIDFRITEGK